MSAIIKQAPYANPDSASLAALMTTADEDTIIRSPLLQSWFRADVGFDGVWGWHCRKTQRPLTAMWGRLPTLEGLPPGGGFNGNPALLFGTSTTNGELYDGGDALLPTGANSWTVVSVSRCPDANHGLIWGNGDSTNPTYLQQTTYGGGQHYFAAIVHGVQIAATLSNHDYNYAMGRHIIMVSYDSAGGALELRCNRGYDTIGPNAVATPNGNSEFHVPNVSSVVAGSQIGAGNGTEASEYLIFTGALHLAANASLLATVEDYAGTRYNCPNGGP